MVVSHFFFLFSPSNSFFPHLLEMVPQHLVRCILRESSEVKRRDISSVTPVCLMVVTLLSSLSLPLSVIVLSGTHRRVLPTSLPLSLLVPHDCPLSLSLSLSLILTFLLTLLSTISSWVCAMVGLPSTDTPSIP